MRQQWESATKEERAAELTRLGYSIKAAFIPFSESRHAKPDKSGNVWRCLNWRVTLSKSGRVLLTTDYAQGEAHLPAYKLPGIKWSLWSDEEARFEIETGRHRIDPSGKSYSNFGPGVAIPPPSIVDICYSLAHDAQAGRSSFSEFCSDFGLDEDSRAARKNWKACRKEYLRIGADNVEELARVTDGF